MKLAKTHSAGRIGGARGGSGSWGYERTNPDYVEQHDRRVVADYFALDPRWRQTFLGGLSLRERKLITAELNRRKGRA